MRGLKQLIYSWIDKKFLAGCSSYNSLAVRKSCRSKFQAREVFADHDIPHALGTTFFWPWTALRFAKKHGFPLVIKPNVSGFSRGSHFPLTCYRDVLKASLQVKIWWPVSVIEQYLLGKNYRVVAIKDEIMSVIQRYPPFIEGDGKSTIDTLIDKENSVREQMGIYPVIHPISKDRLVRGYLRKSGRSLETVPAEGERVYLFNRVALAPGGVVKIIDKESLPIENRELFTRVVDLFGANILGIDAIFTDDINKSYNEQECIFLEVNSRPYLKMHDVPRYGEKEDLQSHYEKLDRLQINEADIF